MMRRLVAMAVVAAVSVFIGVVVTDPITAAATEGEMVITEDTVLTEDHSGTVLVAADDVTLDCANHVVSGAGQLIGIDMRGRTGTTLVNCEVAGYVTGVELGQGASNNTISHNYFHDNTNEGIAVGEATGNLLSMNRSDDNGVFGFLLSDSSSNTVKGNTASGNGGPGFSFGGASENNEVIDNTATFNEDGFALVGGSQGNILGSNEATNNLNGGFRVEVSSAIVLEGNSATNNGSGFGIAASSDVTLFENTANDNTSWGFILAQGTTGAVLTKNSASGNDKIGFALNTVSGNSLVDNHATGQETNFDLLDSDSNFLEGNVATGGVRGFHLGNSDGNTFVDNKVVATTFGAGFVFNNSSHNTVTGNLAERNQAQGFNSFLGSQGNKFTSNSSHGNSDTGFSDASPELNTYVDNICVANAQGSDPNGLCDESGSFTDDDGNTFELDIEWMNREGITKGCNPPTNDEFCPDDSVTRGQMAAFLVRALGYTDDGGGDLFTDDNNSVFENDIDKLATAGVTKGCNPPTNNNYCPGDLVTRGQMAAFLVRAMGYTDDGAGDLFTDDDGNTFEADIDKLGTAGVTKGCNPPTNDEFCPNDFVTRGQMAAFLRRALDN